MMEHSVVLQGARAQQIFTNNVSVMLHVTAAENTENSEDNMIQCRSTTENASCLAGHILDFLGAYDLPHLCCLEVAVPRTCTFWSLAKYLTLAVKMLYLEASLASGLLPSATL